jgi:hypothetical protein
MPTNPIIRLGTITAPGATPIANNATSAKTFANDYQVLFGACPSIKERKSIAILGLIYYLQHAGGANYAANHKGLIQDAQVYSGAISNFDLVTADAVCSFNAGRTAASSNPTTSIPDMLAEAQDLKQLSPEQLDRIITFLRVQASI